MFGRYFKRAISTILPGSYEPKKRDLFTELFPLSEDNKSTLENSCKGIITEGSPRKYKENHIQYENLIFNSLGWNQIEHPEIKFGLQGDFGELLRIDIVPPNGRLEKGKSLEQLPVYRNWLREMVVPNNGGLVMCECIETSSGISGYESITKMPRKEQNGVDYTYFLNLNDYVNQKLYQLMVFVPEGNPTGVRDNWLIHPLSKIAHLEPSEIIAYYRKDPYDDNFQLGNRMNLSEREELDYLIPTHPLSAIRQEIRPRLIKNIKFVNV